MGFFDKVKNMFTEEVEEDDVKVQQIKKEVTHVPIESPVKEEKPINNEYSFNQGMNFSKPVFFDEDDFEDLNFIEKREEKKEKPKAKEEKKEPPKKEKPVMYSGNSVVEKEETKIFKPTPIISPVYGILDKNYHKEDIVDRTIANDLEFKEDKIDMVREKAYGTLEDELENTLFGNSILFKKDDEETEDSDEEVEIEEIDEDSISSLTEDVGKELDQLLENKKKRGLLKSKKTNEKKQEKEEIDEDEDLLGFIDSTLYKDGDEE